MSDSTNDVDIQKLSPDKLLTRFRRSGLTAWLLLAFAVHVIVLGGTSVDYIHGLVDPAWKAEQQRLAEEARRRQQEAGRPARATTAPATRPAARPAEAAKPAPKPKDRRLPEELTTMPTKNEIPTLPGTGIGLEEVED